MIIEIDTRKMKFKEDDMLIYGSDKKFTIINKKDLLAPLYKKIDKLQKDMEIKDKELAIKFEEFKVEKIKELITRWRKQY